MSKHFRLTYCPPLGRHIPVDVELLAALHGDCRKEVQMFAAWQREADYPLPEDWWTQERQAMLRGWQTPRWKKLVVWGAAIVAGTLAWAAIIWGVFKLGDWITGRF